jgi:RNA polymerase sigma factor (sigma-70 family)
MATVGPAVAPGHDLSDVRERQLVAAAALGEPQAVAALVQAFMPGISGISRRYRNARGVDRPELLQEGVVGLLRAVQRFDPTLGTPFWAYASWWVRQAMQQLVSEVSRPTALSDRALRGLARVKEARSSFVQEHSRQPSLDELAEAADLPRGNVESLLSIERTPRGLEEPTGGEDGSATLGDLLPDPGALEEFDQVIEQIQIDEVRDITKTLPDRERSILAEHYGLGREARTLREIGDDLGLSAERVRQIEEQALGRLRTAVATSAHMS